MRGYRTLAERMRRAELRRGRYQNDPDYRDREVSRIRELRSRQRMEQHNAN